MQIIRNLKQSVTLPTFALKTGCKICGQSFYVLKTIEQNTLKTVNMTVSNLSIHKNQDSMVPPDNNDRLVCDNLKVNITFPWKYSCIWFVLILLCISLFPNTLVSFKYENMEDKEALVQAISSYKQQVVYVKQYIVISFSSYYFLKRFSF